MTESAMNRREQSMNPNDNSAGQRIWTCRRHARKARAMDGEHQSATAGDWGPVYGELLTFDDPSPRLPAIDRIEGFHPGRRNLYQRMFVPVHARESIVSAWLDIGDTAVRRGTKLIQSGIWSE